MRLPKWTKINVYTGVLVVMIFAAFALLSFNFFEGLQAISKNKAEVVLPVAEPIIAAVPSPLIGEWGGFKVGEYDITTTFIFRADQGFGLSLEQNFGSDLSPRLFEEAKKAFEAGVGEWVVQEGDVLCITWEDIEGLVALINECKPYRIVNFPSKTILLWNESISLTKY